MDMKLEHFMAEWGGESALTLRLLHALTDSSLEREMIPGYRSIGGLVWHIVTSIGSILGQAGVTFGAPDKRAPAPATLTALAASYEQVVQAAREAIAGSWSDTLLDDPVSMYGQPWTKAQTLRMLIQHEVHHRGQLTVLMRLAGLTLPEIYGPTKDSTGKGSVPG